VAAATGTSKAEADASASLDLPTAKSGSHDESFGLEGTLSTTKEYSDTETDNSTYDIHETRTSSCETTTTCKTDNSKLDIVQGDHVKIGDEGDQRICLETEYDLSMQGSAQNAATALNIINASGRNNIAAAWNLASSAGGSIGVDTFVGAGAASTPGTIHQVNVVKQVN
jgi:hypothetical protein